MLWLCVLSADGSLRERFLPGFFAGSCPELLPPPAGVESITVYEEILRQAHYRLRHGAALYARKFRLSCSEMNGRYSSNEFIVEVFRGSPSLYSCPAVEEPRWSRLRAIVGGSGHCTEEPRTWQWQTRCRRAGLADGL